MARERAGEVKIFLRERCQMGEGRGEYGGGERNRFPLAGAASVDGGGEMVRSHTGSGRWRLPVEKAFEGRSVPLAQGYD
jgi:hypothetical protein